jgi:hypothetical protein
MKNVGERKAQNSRIEKVKIKLQAAMEYLMTYGWAILIIAWLWVFFTALEF